MIRKTSIFCGLTAFLVSTSMAQEQVRSPQGEGGFPFGWIEGCWQTPSGGTEEVWDRGSAALLFGYGLSKKNGEVHFFEQLRLEQTAAGWVYAAYPRGEGPISFASTKMSGMSATFENPQHDDPQMISYTRRGEELAVQISLLGGVNTREWVYVPCAD